MSNYQYNGIDIANIIQGFTRDMPEYKKTNTNLNTGIGNTSLSLSLNERPNTINYKIAGVDISQYSIAKYTDFISSGNITIPTGCKTLTIALVGGGSSGGPGGIQNTYNYDNDRGDLYGQIYNFYNYDNDTAQAPNNTHQHNNYYVFQRQVQQQTGNFHNRGATLAGQRTANGNNQNHFGVNQHNNNQPTSYNEDVTVWQFNNTDFGGHYTINNYDNDYAGYYNNTHQHQHHLNQTGGPGRGGSGGGFCYISNLQTASIQSIQVGGVAQATVLNTTGGQYIANAGTTSGGTGSGSGAIVATGATGVNGTTNSGGVSGISGYFASGYTGTGQLSTNVGYGGNGGATSVRGTATTGTRPPDGGPGQGGAGASGIRGHARVYYYF